MAASKILKSLLARYQELTESNDHTGAAIALVESLGNQEELSTLRLIEETSSRRGYILQAEISERDRIANGYYRMLKHMLK